MSETSPSAAITPTIIQSTQALVQTIWRLTYPIAMGRLVQAMAGFIDIAMVGNLGVVSIAAVGIGRQIVFISEITMLGVIVGAQALVARAVGQRDSRQVSVVARQAIVFGALVSFLFGAAGALTAENLMQLVGATDQVLALGTIYTRIYFAGIFANMLSHIVINMLQAAGESKIAFYIVGAINLLHVILDYLFIYGVGPFGGLGVGGAALGMITSRLIGWFIGMFILYSGKWRVALTPETSYRPDWELIGRLFHLGIPVALQGLGRSGASLVFLRILAGTPSATIGLAAFAIGSRLDQLSVFIASAFSVTALALVGQSMGSQDAKEAERRGWAATWLCVVALGGVGVMFFVFAAPLVSLFTPDPDVRQAGTIYLQINALAQPFMALIQVISGSLQGAGDTRSPFYLTMTTQWLLYLPLTILFVFSFGLGTSGAWWATTLTAVVQALWLAKVFWQGKWKNLAV